MSEATARRRKALREFYKLQQAAAAAAENDSAESPETQEDESPSSPSDIPEDHVEDYMKKLIMTSDIKTLLQTENKLLTQIKGLDSEQKALIYNNYDKLIMTSNMLDKQMNNAHDLTVLHQLSGNLTTVSQMIKAAPKPHENGTKQRSHDLLVAREAQWLLNAETQIEHLATTDNLAQAKLVANDAIALIDKWQPILKSDELSTIRENCHKLMLQYKLHDI